MSMRLIKAQVTTDAPEEENVTCDTTTAADLVFLVDDSGSIGLSNFQLILIFLENLVQGFMVDINQIRVGLVQFSSQPRLEFNLTTHMTREAVVDAIRNLTFVGGGTDIASALTFVLENSFTAEFGSRANVPKVLILITDGQSSTNVSAPAQALRDAGIQVFAVGVGNANEDELREIASPPPETHVFNVVDFDAISGIEGSLITSICEEIPEEENVTCDTTTAADLVFLVDGSGSIGPNNFQLILIFLENLVQGFMVDINQIRVGLVQFSSQPRLEFNLTTHMTREAVVDAIRNLTFVGGGTDTASALTFVLENSFTAEFGSRANVPKVLILITDGQSSTNVSAPAQALRDAGIQVFAVGVGNANEDELREIASPPPETHVFNVVDFDAISGIEGSLITSICEEIPEEENVTCDTTTAADLVFLVDGSGSIGPNNFQLILIFLENLVQGFMVDINQIRVGLVQFSSQPRLEFNLTTHMTREAVVDAIRNLTFVGGGTDTASALTFVLENSFTAEFGSRANVPKVLILITDGQSSTNVSAPAQALRDAGIQVFAVGVGNANEDELREIASPPPETHVFNVVDFDAISGIEGSLITSICEEIPEEENVTCDTTTAADLVFLVDGSGSIGPNNFQLILIFLENLVQGFMVDINQIRVGLVQFSSQPRLEFNLTTHMTREAVVDAIRNLTFVGGGTDTASALTFVLENSFTAEFGSRANVPKVLILITDGQSSTNVSAPAQALRDAGIQVFAVGVGNANEDELREIASPPPETHVFNVVDFDAISGIEGSLITSICEEIPEEENVTCDTTTAADLVFLVDGSGSIGPNNFQLILIFLENLVQGFMVDINQIRVGLVQFSSQPRLEFNLTTHMTREAVVDAIRNLTFVGGGTDTASALTFVLENSFTAEFGSRANVPKVLILITDGQSSTNVSAPAQALRDAGIQVFAVGVGNANEDELREIASPPPETHVFNVVDFDAISGIEGSLITSICEEIPEEENVTCDTTTAADLVFLVDGSGSIGPNNFQLILIFLENLVQGFMVDINQIRVGLVQFSSQPRLEFNLTTHMTREAVVDAIRNLTFVGGGTDTASALTFVLENSFTAEFGSRANVPKVLILITDGQSSTNVSAPAQALRDAGIQVFAVGVGNANEDELREIASPPPETHVFNVVDFDAISGIEGSLITSICEEIPEEENVTCDTTTAADLVFLVDGSGSIGPNNFQLILIFLENLVQGFMVDINQIRVGLVQFSSQPRLEFNLTTHMTREAVVDAIRNLTFVGGGTDTASALTFVLENSFTAEFGSRANVPKVLILITDGQSSTNVSAPAQALRDAGIQVFAVGVGNANEDELREIASPPPETHVFNVVDFDAISGIEGSLITSICEEIPEEENVTCDTTTAADLVFLVDGSGSIGPNNFQLILIFLENLVQGFMVDINQIRVGLVQFSSQPRLEFNLTTHMTREAVVDAIRNLTFVGGGTDTASALTFVLENSFTAEFGSRANVPKVLILITDGQSSTNVSAPAQALRDAGIQVFAVGVGNANEDELREIASPPPETHVFNVVDFDAISGIEGSLITSICEEIPEEENVTCDTTTAADLVFLVDGSGSIGPNNFQLILIFLENLVQGFMVDINQIRVGLVQFSSQPRLEFNLTTHMTREAVVDAIRNLTFVGGGTDTASALTFVLENSFTAEFGSRANVPKVLILITDGQSSTNVSAPAQALRDAGIQVFAVGVGNANEDELREIASPPPETHVFNVVDFDAISGIEGSLITSICEEIPEEENVTCDTTTAADLVFLVDGSGSIGPNNFQLILIFLENLVQGFMVDINQIRVGLVQFSSQPRLEFNLTTHMTREAVVDAIRNLTFVGGGTDTASALTFVLENSFTAEFGSRANVPKVLILITDGQSSTNVSAPAQALRDAGIQVFAVGVGNANEDELREIASPPPETHVFNVVDFDAISGIEGSLITSICEEIPEEENVTCDTTTAADLVFLVDGSGSIGPNNFQLILIFLENLVQGFMVDINQIRVGLVQFSSQPRLEFNLTTHMTREAVVDAIRNLTFVGGGTDTASALTFVLENSFTAEFGSRANVPKVLILITDGQSSTNVSAPAQALRDAGIQVFAVGVGNANEDELREIASPPPETHVFNVVDFDAISGIEGSLITSICEEIPARPSCPRNSQYSPCIPACSPTCRFLNCPPDCTHNRLCKPGCVCDDGFVLKRGVCVPIQQCGCVDTDGNKYGFGQVWYTKHCGQKCRCERYYGIGKIDCEKCDEEFKKHQKLFVDGQKTKTPVSPSLGLKIKKRSSHIYLTTDFGLSVKFDARSGAEITLPRTYKRKESGMTG
ncbi:collagen alpha-3(VI) chain-like isoform X2 [Vanacampus margaritifer]